jgi:hypothetical protein
LNLNLAVEARPPPAAPYRHVRLLLRVKIVTAILIFQAVLGLVVALFAFGDVHSSAMGMEYGRGLQREFEQMRQSPEYREPPAVLGHSLARLFEDRYTHSRQRGYAALLACAAGLGASLLAGLNLWLLSRVRRRSNELPTT